MYLQKLAFTTTLALESVNFLNRAGEMIFARDKSLDS